MKKTLIALAAIVTLASCCCNKKSDYSALKLDPANFEKVIDGKQVQLFTIENDNMAVQFTNYGARMTSLIVPDRNGEYKDVIWGFDSIDGYLNSQDHFAGPVVGRFANRIAEGKFSIDGVEYNVVTNEGPNQLHGGPKGYYACVWDGKTGINEKGEPVMEFHILSPDGDQGFPGNLEAWVTYTLTKDNALVINYKAVTDKATPVNLTFHPYLNLHGTTEKSSNSHKLMIPADGFTPCGPGLIPTGEIQSVEGTVNDFRQPTEIGSRAKEEGYDLNFVLGTQGKQCCKSECGKYALAAVMAEPETGIKLEVFTDKPGIQFYSGPAMNGKDVGKRGQIFHRFSGVALETQDFPDAPNHANFPNTILRPGETYTHNAVFKFSVCDKCKGDKNCGEKHECKDGKKCGEKHDCGEKHGDCCKDGKKACDDKPCDKCEK